MGDENYRYDVFLSYRRRWPVDDWVKHHFYPALKGWLGESLQREPDIFFDAESINTGTDWPTELQQAHTHSRCLLPVWTRLYFASKWCSAEWRSVRF